MPAATAHAAGATVAAADVGGPASTELTVPGQPVMAATTLAGVPAGDILPFGAAKDEGSLAGRILNQPIVGMAATPNGTGYWLVAADGGVFPFGPGAHYYGSTGAVRLNQPIVGMAAAPDGDGYWLVAADGGVFPFGPGAHYYGSTGAVRLNQPIVGMAAGGNGYWLVAADGGVFPFGPGAHYYGSTGNVHLNQPIVGMAAAPDGDGYWLVAADGGVFPFGPGAHYFGSAGGRTLSDPVIGIIAAAPGAGYWLVEGERGRVPVGQLFTPAVTNALNGRAGIITAAVLDLNTGALYEYRPGQTNIDASIVKVQILGTLLSEAQAQGRSLGPSEQGLATEMIEDSDNDAATALWNDDGGAPAVAAFDESVGMTDTVPNPAWGLTTTTAADQISLLRHLVDPNPVLTDQSRDYELDLMEHVTPGQAFGVSAGVPAGVTLALKNGWLPVSNGWTVNSVGWVDGDGRDYLIAVLTGADPSETDGIDSIGIVSQAAWATL